MDVTVKKLPGSKAELSVTLPWDEWKKEIDHAALELAKDVKVAGFRPGKVPRDVIEKRFGKQVLLVEAAEHAVRHSYPKALEKEKVDAIGEPDVNLGKLLEGEELSYTVTTSVMPEVKLKDWKEAVEKVNREAQGKEEAVDETEVENELKRLAEMRAKFVTVSRRAKMGDNVLVDFTVTQGGVIIEGGKSENHPLVLGKGVFIPGFEEQIVGMKEGEEKTFTLSFPAEYHANHLAGKEAEFAVKVRVVQEREVPTIDDAFAKSLGKFENLEKVKEQMKIGMLDEKKTKQKEERRTRILDILVLHSEIDAPDILVEQEMNRMIREFEAQIGQMGFDFQTYLKETKKTEADMRKEWLPQAKKRLAAELVIDSLAKEQEIEVDTKTIEEEMNKTLSYYKNTKDAEKNIDMERLYSAVQSKLRNEKILEWLESL